MKPLDLRRRSRVRSPGVVQLWIGGGDWITGTIHDVSAFGICVETEREAAPGSPVRIAGMGFHGAGLVRHCSTCGTAFRLGLELFPHPDESAK
jgi:hypothetical protein